MGIASHGAADAEVLVVGAGPVGLALAYALGQRGIRCVLVERSLEPGTLPKMDLTNPRSMEIFRRLGLAEKIRDAGWPLDAHFDVYAGPSLAEPVYAVLNYPSILEMQAEIAACRDGSMPREPYERISQYHLEALLRREGQKLPDLSIEFGSELVSLEQHEDHVVAGIRAADGSERHISAAYVVGCDGGGSRTRRLLNIDYKGLFAVGRVYMIFFHCPELLEKAGLEAFRHYMIAGDRQATFVAQDDLRHWSLHVAIDADRDAETLDPVTEIRASLGIDIEPEILHAGVWTPHLIVAERYRQGRVFLAGDSVHQYIPTGGFGMNTGVAEADNLAWKLAAVLRGWAGEALLDSYEEERLPVALRNCRAAEYAASGVGQWRALYDPAVRDGSSGVRRRQLVAAFNTYQRRSHEQRGTEMGYRYTRSGVCLHEDGPLPDPDSPVYTPNAAPGARLPHAWIGPDLSVHDRIGWGMTLLAFDASASEIAHFHAAAAALGVPLEVVELPGKPDLRSIYGADLLLVRPDLHVAWRGASGADAIDILTIATGREGLQHHDGPIMPIARRKELS